MKAVVYTRYGPPEVLSLQDIAKPFPKDNELLIRVHAAEVTKADCELRSFKLPVKWTWLPMRLAFGLRKPRKQVLGMYFAGEVEAVGQQVKRLKVGDQVFGSAGFRMGAYGEYLCLPETYTVVPKPVNLSFEQAAGVPLGGLNALHFLRLAKVQAGERVLINGAGGSIGSFAVQIAKTMGAEVTAVDSANKEEMLRKLGANHFIDYRQEDFRQGAAGFDVILNMVARGSYSKTINALNDNGRYLMANPRVSDMFRVGYTNSFSSKAAYFAFAKESQEELFALKEMLEQEQIGVALDRVYSMEQAAEAHHRVETEQRLGVVVLRLQA